MSDESNAYVTPMKDGGWRIADSRVSLDSIVRAYWDGRQPEVMLSDFPSLTLENVYGALAYYFRHRAEVDRYLANQDDRWAAFQKESEAKNGKLLQRVRYDRIVYLPL